MQKFNRTLRSPVSGSILPSFVAGCANLRSHLFPIIIRKRFDGPPIRFSDKLDKVRNVDVPRFVLKLSSIASSYPFFVVQILLMHLILHLKVIRIDRPIKAICKSDNDVSIVSRSVRINSQDCIPVLFGSRILILRRLIIFGVIVGKKSLTCLPILRIF